MAFITYSGHTQTQITVNIGHNGSVVDNFKLYCDGQLFPGSTGSFSSTTSHSAQRTKTGLTAGSSHGFSVYYYRGTTLVDSDSGRWSTDVATPTVGSLAGNVSASKGGTYAPTTVSFSWGSASNATSYEYSGSANGSTPGNSVSLGTVGAGSYSLTVTPKNGSTTGGSGSASITISNPPADTTPPTITNFAVTSVTGTSIKATGSATDPSGVDSLGFYMSAGFTYTHNSAPTTSMGTVSGGSGSYTYQPLTPGMYYSIGLYALDTKNNLSPQSIIYNVRTPGNKPVGTPTVTYTQADLLDYNISWSGVSGATSYEVWAQGTAGDFKKATTSSTSAVIHLDNFATTYTIRVKPLNADGYGTTGTTTITTTETTPPVATITLTPDSTNVQVNWSVVDNPGPGDGGASGFRHMLVNISVPGNSTTYYVTQINSASGSFAFTTDGKGNPILPNTQYRFYFQAYDNQFNEAIVDRYVTTLAPTRPDNFAWSTAKVSGQPFNLTAAEWTDLYNRVQAFRVYKVGSTYSFDNTFITGWAFTAVHFNEMRAAIASMSPPTSPPGAVTTGGTVFAAQLNGLRDSLNSIP